MHRLLIAIPLVLAGCMAAGPEVGEPFYGEPVTQGVGWAGCEAEGGLFQTGQDGGLVCVAN